MVCRTASSSYRPARSSSASSKTYDVEIWFPSQGRYRETASISNTTDFQARRLGIRVRGESGPEPLHMLNGTAVVDRMALAILENSPGGRPDVRGTEGLAESAAEAAPKGWFARPTLESDTCGMRGKCASAGRGAELTAIRGEAEVTPTEGRLDAVRSCALPSVRRACET